MLLALCALFYFVGFILMCHVLVYASCLCPFPILFHSDIHKDKRLAIKATKQEYKRAKLNKHKWGRHKEHRLRHRQNTSMKTGKQDLEQMTRYKKSYRQMKHRWAGETGWDKDRMCKQKHDTWGLNLLRCTRRQKKIVVIWLLLVAHWRSTSIMSFLAAC